MAPLVLALWALPTAHATALSVHVVLDHHHHHHESHQTARADLLAAAHGHHHPEIVPDHEHSATSCEAPAGLHQAAELDAVETVFAAAAPMAPITRTVASRARPPDRLFYAHCSLLL